MLHLFSPATLKFKIVALAVVTGVLSSLISANFVLIRTRGDFEQTLLRSERNARIHTAALLGSKIETLLASVQTIGRNAPYEVWGDPRLLERFLLGNGSGRVLFDTMLGITPDGQVQAVVSRVPRRTAQLNVAQRDYFQQALRSDQPVISTPLKSLGTGLPIVVIATSVRNADNMVVGVVAGSIELRSSPLFAELSDDDGLAEARYLIMDRQGRLVVHSDPRRTLESAETEIGFGPVFKRWHGSGSPIDLEGSAEFSGDWLISRAGIPGSDWTLAELTPLSAAMHPIMVAQSTGRWTAAAVAAGVALIAGVVAWLLTRPITALRSRARQLLNDDNASTADWPAMRGELGSLARAFRRVVEQRQRKHEQTQSLLHQLEAVLAHVDTGIAMTREGSFQLVSRSLCEILGHEAHQLQGQSTAILHGSPEAHAAFRAQIRPSLEATGSFEAEVELVRRDGQPIWAHVRGRAIVRGDRAEGSIWAIQDITQERARREQLVWTAGHDSLTGLANRASFDTQIALANEHAAQEPACAMFIDLDRFKQVNDTGGHAAGDALLRDLASQLVSKVRRSDLVARFGGDEFAVLLRHCSLDQARVIAENIRRAVIDYRLHIDGHQFGVGASIGVVHMGGEFDSAEAVLKAADTACYAAKQRGRNAVVVHGD